MTVFPRYSRFLGPWIVKTVNSKTANIEGRLYFTNVQRKCRTSKFICIESSFTLATFSYVAISNIVKHVEWEINKDYIAVKTVTKGLGNCRPSGPLMWLKKVPEKVILIEEKVKYTRKNVFFWQNVVKFTLCRALFDPWFFSLALKGLICFWSKRICPPLLHSA